MTAAAKPLGGEALTVNRPQCARPHCATTPLQLDQPQRSLRWWLSRTRPPWTRRARWCDPKAALLSELFSCSTTPRADIKYVRRCHSEVKSASQWLAVDGVNKDGPGPRGCWAVPR